MRKRSSKVYCICNGVVCETYVEFGKKNETSGKCEYKLCIGAGMEGSDWDLWPESLVFDSYEKAKADGDKAEDNLKKNEGRKMFESLAGEKTGRARRGGPSWGVSDLMSDGSDRMMPDF